MPQPDWIGLYLQEDLDDAGDITSTPIFGDSRRGEAHVVARQDGRLAGVGHAAEIFQRLGCTTKQHMKEGSWIHSGDVLLSVAGPTASILAAERTALNLLGRMTGIATRAQELVAELARHCSGTRIAATRKTTPGFRRFEKEAVAIGGGEPHRLGLYDAAMIKDNHREAAGDLAAAMAAVRAAHPDKGLTVEVESERDACLAAENGADWILIDNQDPDTGRRWAEAAWHIRPTVKIEASGGITPDNMVAYGWADRISMGFLTHHAVSADVSLVWGAAPR